jgi:L-asparagine transporter-like permease
VDSALPESTSFTLVDALHGLTLFSIFAVIACTAISLLMVKKNKIAQAKRFDMIAAQTLLVIYIVVNIILISKAADT